MAKAIAEKTKSRAVSSLTKQEKPKSGAVSTLTLREKQSPLLIPENIQRQRKSAIFGDPVGMVVVQNIIKATFQQHLQTYFNSAQF
ncbi:hypothetical protein [Mangrovibacterium marinum]|uniref:Uncharacterized protein n=1 Tax=Mangrovibacterium marinum TaxID=1639118 RepID=A0A2T5C4V9_9BACT|nr:hypothetical protein [Mangrovibacterium marinum]PTN09905.1 hypothetical protein C8N47_103202 [Mangrovibacterium marinum]